MLRSDHLHFCHYFFSWLFFIERQQCGQGKKIRCMTSYHGQTKLVVLFYCWSQHHKIQRIGSVFNPFIHHSMYSQHLKDNKKAYGIGSISSNRRFFWWDPNHVYLRKMHKKKGCHILIIIMLCQEEAGRLPITQVIMNSFVMEIHEDTYRTCSYCHKPLLAWFIVKAVLQQFPRGHFLEKSEADGILYDADYSYAVENTKHALNELNNSCSNTDISVQVINC